LFDSHAGGRTDSAALLPLTLENLLSRFPLEQGIAMMAAGDSASFLGQAPILFIESI
jgi:hypothetical protein